MPDARQLYDGWTPAEIERRAARIGPTAAALVELVLTTKTHAEQGFRDCLGIVRLAKSEGKDSVDAACLRALEIGAATCSSVKSILPNNQHRKRPEAPAVAHARIRRADNVHGEGTNMLDHPTHGQRRELKLDGMADAFKELQARDDSPDLSHAEWLGLVIDREAASRSTKKAQSRMRAAKLRHVGASIEDVDFRTPMKLFKQLATGRWIDAHRKLACHRAPSPLCLNQWRNVGKAWLACAFGQKACRDGKAVLHHRVPRLFADLELAHGDA